MKANQLIAGVGPMAEAEQPNAVSPNQPPEGVNVPESNIWQVDLIGLFYNFSWQPFGLYQIRYYLSYIK